jgi:serine/threonine-protein kinase
MPTIVTHPDPQTLAAFAVGRLAEPRRGEVEAHVAGCDECCRRLEHVGPDSLLGLAQAAMATEVAGLGETVGPAPGLPPELHDHPRYLVLEQLGAGGMGVVFKAEHRIMGRLVALKVLSGRTMAKAGAVERFRREVRLASRLAHPNIVTAFDADEAGGHHFLVMEYVEGVTLDKLVARRGPLPVAMACHFVRQAALGLRHAHEKGMIHRDIKPQNLVVTAKGQVKVLDFGLACVARGDGESASETAAQMTSPDMVLGTPDFLSPEQARNSTAVDGRTDLYSLGCTLFYLLTGRPPFGGTQPFDKLVAHVQDPVPAVAAARPDVPADLSDLVGRMMAKDPADRPQTPAEVAAALLPFTKAGAAPAAAPVLDATPLAVAKPVGVPLEDTLVEEAGERSTDVVGFKPRRRKPAPVVWNRRAALAAGAIALALLLGGAAWAAYSLFGDRLAGSPSSRSGGGGPTPRNPGTGPGTPQVPAGAREVLIVIPPKHVWGPEFDALHDGLRQGGLAVSTASLTRAPSSRHPDHPGPAVAPNYALNEVVPSRYSCVVFVGADVDEYLPGKRGAADVDRIIADHVRRGRPIVGVCLGMRVLTEGGYLNGQVVARPRADLMHLFNNQRVTWKNEGVCQAFPFVTAGTDRDVDELLGKLVPHLHKLR